jgi:hypothetical protein
MQSIVERDGMRWDAAVRRQRLIGRRLKEDVGRHARRANAIARARLRKTLACVLEFTDVAGPRISLQQLSHGVREHRRASRLPEEAGHEVIGQRRYIFAALAQWRQPDGENVQPIKQVLAELAGGNHTPQAAFRSRDDTHVHGDRPSTTDSLDHALLNHAQQLDLNGRRHIVDIVEKDRSAVSHLEPTGTIADRTGERTQFVPKQFRLDQRLGKNRAADRNERAAPAWATVVDETSDDLFTGSRLANDENVALTVLDHAQEIEDRAHPPASSNHDRIGRECGLVSQVARASESYAIEFGHEASAPQPRCQRQITRFPNEIIAVVPQLLPCARSGPGIAGNPAGESGRS